LYQDAFCTFITDNTHVYFSSSWKIETLNVTADLALMTVARYLSGQKMTPWHASVHFPWPFHLLPGTQTELRNSAMNNALLSLEQTPPIAVPLRFMLAAPFFAALAGVVSLFHPEALANRWNPATLAITHLLTLGFISMVMVGSLQQLLPVLAGARLRNPNLFSLALCTGLMTGTLLLSSGFIWFVPLLLAAGTFILVASFLLMIMTLLISLLRSDASLQVTLGMKLALLAFLITLVLGAYLVAGYLIESVPLNRVLTGLHVQWGILGWIGLLVVTVSYQVVPMFQVTPKYPNAIRTYLSPVLFVLLLLIATSRILAESDEPDPGWLQIVLEAMLLTGFFLFTGITVRLQQLRRRKVPDVTLDYFRLGLFALVLAFIAAGLNTFQPGLSGMEGLIGILFLAGFAMSIITGMLYKIVPFLVWLHLTNSIDMSSRWQMKIPNMKKIIPVQHARNQFWMHFGALFSIAVSLWLTELSVLASLLFIGSNLYLAYNLIRGALVYKNLA